MLDKKKYENILNKFELLYPGFSARAVSWWASGRMSITVKLNNGEFLEYNSLDNNIRFVQSGQHEDDEERQCKALGHNLQKMLPFSNMSKSEFAEKLGITNAMLSRYLHGKSMPSGVRLYRIANLIGCSVEELFDENYMEE